MLQDLYALEGSQYHAISVGTPFCSSECSSRLLLSSKSSNPSRTCQDLRQQGICRRREECRQSCSILRCRLQTSPQRLLRKASNRLQSSRTVSLSPSLISVHLAHNGLLVSRRHLLAGGKTVKEVLDFAEVLEKLRKALIPICKLFPSTIFDIFLLFNAPPSSI
jgi:hypothetical protein